MNAIRTNPALLELARESRGLTQRGLSQKSGIEQYILSRYEHGISIPTEEHLQIISKILDYPIAFFSRSESITGFGSTCMYHRKRQSLAMRDLRRLHAKVNITRMNIERLLLSVEIDAKHEIPRLDIVEYGDPEHVAEIVRLAWRLPMGPIKNILATIENAGGIIVLFPFETQKMDAISQLTADMTPIFCINDRMPWDRIRFSLAHELGHLIMHRNPTKDQEAEADAFASAFLMPRRDIRTQLSPMSLTRAAELKSYWKVSMQAIIRRAYVLRQISESRYRKLFTELSKKGYRLNEPGSLPPDIPFTLRSLVNVHSEQLHYSLDELCQLLLIPKWEFEQIYLLPPGAHIREVRVA